MTVLEDEVSVEIDTDEIEESGEEGTAKTRKGRKRDLDFTKCTEAHEELAAYVNERSGLSEITGNHIKAITTLRQDWADTDEQKTKRENAKAARAEAAKKYEGLTPEQIVVEKAVEKAEQQAERLRQRVEAAMAKAKSLREGHPQDAPANGADVDVEVDDNGKKGRFGRRK